MPHVSGESPFVTRAAGRLGCPVRCVVSGMDSVCPEREAWKTWWSQTVDLIDGKGYDSLGI